MTTKKNEFTFKDGEIQHLVIRQHNYVAGTDTNPEVKVFMQTRKNGSPINTKYLAKNQTVWMKWSGGPIVARAKLTSWLEGKIVNGDISKARAQTIGTSLYDLEDYWDSVKKKRNANYVIFYLDNEEWLDEIIFPEERSRGGSWIFIDDKQKFNGWIKSEKQEKKYKKPNRNLPKSLRFKILRRDNFTCQYCGRKAPQVILHVDHVIPWSIVKKHEESNLKTACLECNLGKSNKY